MKCLDSAFCIDLANGLPAARAKAADFVKTGERLVIPAFTAFMLAAFYLGGRRLAQALEFISELEVLDLPEPISMHAARTGGEWARRGEPVSTVDLLIAATAMHHHAGLVGRDTDFARVPGLTLETY